MPVCVCVCRFSTNWLLPLLLLFLFIGWQRIGAAYLQQIVSPDVLEGKKSPNAHTQRHTHTNTRTHLRPDGSHSL